MNKVFDMFRLLNRKRVLIILILFLLAIDLRAQETKLIVKEGSTRPPDNKTIKIGWNDDFVEEYYVLKTDAKIRHGTYVKYRHSRFGISVLESGRYQNGQKTGVWEVYHNSNLKGVRNSIREKGAYVNGKKNGVWKTFYRDTIPETVSEERFGRKKRVDSVKLAIDQRSAKLKTAGMYLNDRRVGEWVSLTYAGELSQKFNFSTQKLMHERSLPDSSTYNTKRRALFIGGNPALMDFLAHEMQWTGPFVENGKADSTSVVISFTIDKKGNTIHPNAGEILGKKEFTAEAIRVIGLTSSNWIPAIFDSQPVESIYKVQFFVIRDKRSKDSHTFWPGYRTIFD